MACGRLIAKIVAATAATLDIFILSPQRVARPSIVNRLLEVAISSPLRYVLRVLLAGGVHVIAIWLREFGLWRAYLNRYWPEIYARLADSSNAYGRAVSKL